MTPETRHAFRAGWDEQELMMRPPTEEQVAASAAVAKRFKEWAEENLR